MIDIKTALTEGALLLNKTSPSARIDAEILLVLTLNTTRTYLYTHPETPLTKQQLDHYSHLLSQRALGYPIAHLTENKEFWSLPLLVNNETLIPRPETELLVQLALSQLHLVEFAHILDLGTGSGAIALALASERPHWEIHAVDNSATALAVAKKNAINLNLSHIQFSQSNWFDAIPLAPFDAIISNPPYIATNDPHLLQGDVRFEPSNALTSGQYGLDAITHIIQHARPYLKPNGFLLIEHGFEQKNAVTELFNKWDYKNIQTWQDWQGNDRVTGAIS